MDILKECLDEMEHPQHKILLVESIRSGDTTSFRYNRHSIKDLSKLVTQFSEYRGHEMTKMQGKALSNYRASKSYNLSSKLTGIRDKDMIIRYFSLFDKVFFFRTLQDRVFIVFDERSTRDTSMGGHASRTKHKWWQPKANTCVITLYTKKSIENRQERLKWYLGVLLHEMIHCFFKLWACGDEECYPGLEQAGKTGHGFAFQNVAYALEKVVADPSFLGLELDLNRNRSLAQELIRSRVLDLPRLLDLDRWELCKDKLVDEIAYQKSEEWEVKRKGMKL